MRHNNSRYLPTIPNYRTYGTLYLCILNYKLPYTYVFDMVWELKTALSNYRWIEHKCGRLKEILNFIPRLLFEINMWPAWIFGMKMWPDTFFLTRKVCFHLTCKFTCLVVKYLVFLKKNVAGVISCAQNVARLKKKKKMWPA